VKTLVVRLSAIGDVVHTLPILSALHRSGFTVGWLVEAPARPLVEGHSFVTHVVEAPGMRSFHLSAARQSLAALREQGYDVALDPQGLWKSALWARLSGARRTIGYSAASRREGLSAVLLGETAELPEDAAHVIDKNLALLRAVGIEAVGSRDFGLPVSPRLAQGVQDRLDLMSINEFVVLNPGGGWPSKLWPPEAYGAVAAGLADRGLRSVVTWGPGEERLAERTVGASGGRAIKCFPTTLLEYLELARRARLVVAADTGPLHLACAAGVPVVGIYGPTDPARNGPFSPHDRVVRRTPLCCPCHRRRCVIHEGVMGAISTDEVLRAIDRRLGRGAPSKAVAV